MAGDQCQQRHRVGLRLVQVKVLRGPHELVGVVDQLGDESVDIDGVVPVAWRPAEGEVVLTHPDGPSALPARTDNPPQPPTQASHEALTRRADLWRWSGFDRGPRQRAKGVGVLGGSREEDLGERSAKNPALFSVESREKRLQGDGVSLQTPMLKTRSTTPVGLPPDWNARDKEQARDRHAGRQTPVRIHDFSRAPCRCGDHDEGCCGERRLISVRAGAVRGRQCCCVSSAWLTSMMKRRAVSEGGWSGRSPDCIARAPVISSWEAPRLSAYWAPSIFDRISSWSR